MYKLDEYQQKALDLDKHLVVEAGAGSGKTRTLVARFLEILRQGKADVDNIVAITFTNKAAGEMKDRIREQLATILKHKELDGDFKQETGYLNKNILWKLNDAFITTIHGFCSGLLQENPIEAGIAPDFKVIEGVEFVTFKNKVIKQYLISLNEGNGANEEIEVFNKILDVESFDFNTVLNTITEIIENITLNFLPWEIINIEDIKKIRVILDKGDKLFNDPKKSILPAIDSIINNTRDSAYEAESELTKQYLIITKNAFRFYQNEKQKQNFLDFNDLIFRAYQLIKENKGVRDYYRKKIKYIMVDEFQDTDSLQYKLIRLFVCDENESLCVKPELPKLFLVGDPKQSIYRFRGADVTVFNKMCNEIHGHDKQLVKLKGNYRSDAPLVDYFNNFFDTLMKPEFDADFEAKYENIANQKSPDNENNRNLQFNIEIITGEKEKAEERRELEAQSIANRIYQLVEEEGFKYKDIAILFRYFSNVHIYEKALQDANIPYYMLRGQNFFKQSEIRDMASIIKLILFPHDNIAKACVLRSPFCGISDEGLFYLFGDKKLFKNLNNINDSNNSTGSSTLLEEVERANKLLEIIDKLRKEASFFTISELLKRILACTGYNVAIAATQGGAQKLANLNKLISIAQKLEADSGYILSDFLEYLNNAVNLVKDEGTAQLQTKKENTVKLITVHSAKGLEFPVVILADNRHEGKLFSNERVIFLSDCGILISSNTLEGEVENAETSAIYQGTKIFAKCNSLAEEKRILYVAQTRAENLLIIPLISSKTGKKKNNFCFGNLIEQTLPILDACKISIKKAEDLDTAVKKLPEEDSKTAFDINEFIEKSVPIKVKVPLITTPTALSHLKYQAIKKDKIEKGLLDNYLEGFLGENIEHFTLSDKELFPTELGTLFHRFMELWNFEKNAIELTLKKVIAEAAVDENISSLLLPMINIFMESGLYKRIKNTKIQKEISFWAKISEPDKYIKGKIDLLLWEGEDYSVIDYKTINNSQEIEKTLGYYTVQLSAYYHALYQILGKNAKDLILYFVSGNEIKVNPLPINELEILLNELENKDTKFDEDERLLPPLSTKLNISI